MTPKQQAFVECYAACCNATEAARKAGYSARYAGTNAEKLLKNTNVQAALAALTLGAPVGRPHWNGMQLACEV
ncbi:MAG: Terminase small subunit [Pseudomonadota bacterium]|nr:Terminase small subunit [Pseudomonadota bacterium]